VTMTLEARFWAKVAKTPTCWLWTASKTTHGYGRFKVEGRNALAHRVAYELEIGSIPDGLQLDHVATRGCTNRNCVNPAHLEPVTPGVNVRRSTAPAAVNARKTHCKRGHEFTPGNTQIHRTGKRHCRTCNRDRVRAARMAV
jgi:hypothetical protein